MQTQNINVTLPIAGFLGIAFIVLKLIGVIGWSWLWVLSPFWIPVVIWVVILLILLVLQYVLSDGKW